MTLNQIFTGLLVLGYDRYIINDHGNPHGIKMTCFLFKPKEQNPSIVAMSATEKHSLEAALKIAWEPEGAPDWKRSNAKQQWKLSEIVLK